MNDNYYNEYPRNNAPWDQNVYQTGSTVPPKKHGALVAVLLAAVIFLGGIASVLGILNIRLFQQINRQPSENVNPVAAFSEPATEQTTAPAETEAMPISPAGEDVGMNIVESPSSVENVPQAGGLSLQQIYEKAIGSVVSITCRTAGGTASGTGVVLSGDGYLVTNCHVVEDAESIVVEFYDGQSAGATLVGLDEVSDLAVLWTQVTGLQAAEFGDSSVLRVGDSVAAIGDPLGAELRGTMTDGIVSAINRDITVDGRTMTLIQTNAALNSGNSGGPLLNCYGQVVGINTMKIGDYMSSAGVEGLGFAIPSTTVKEIVDQLVSQGYVSGRPSLGLSGESVSLFYQMYYRLPEGLYLTEVEPGSEAETAGIQPGDILLSIDGTRITGPDELHQQLYAHQAGDTVELVIYRGGRQYTVALVLEEAKK